MGLDKKLIERINIKLLKKIKINITFLNIVNMRNLSKRLKIRKTKNRYDYFKIAFYKKVQNGFTKLAKNKSRYITINSNESLRENKIKVLNKIIKLIN